MAPLRMKLKFLLIFIKKLERKQDDLNNTIEDFDEYKKQWDEIEEKIKIFIINKTGLGIEPSPV